jgi:hypothetical protein
MGMSIPYEATGRTQQKVRTRNALIQAARELLGTGVTPTVEQAADAARVSRTTAYRPRTRRPGLTPWPRYWRARSSSTSPSCVSS